MNLLSIAKNFATEDQAIEHLIRQRWPDGIRCVKCDSDRISRITSTGKTGKIRRVLECMACRNQFTATSGTLFHDSHLPLQKWFMAMALMCEAKKGVSALQISRHIGVTHKTAWYLCHRIRKAMEEINAGPLGGQGQIVEIDEAFLGGRTPSRKTSKEKRDAKVKIVGLAERGGRVRLQRVENFKAESLRPVIAENLSPDASQVVTDGAAQYSFIIPKKKHVATNHAEELATKGEVSMKTVEGAFSLFKRGVVGSYHRLSKDHLDSYLQEFCWRYNRRGMQPWMFDTLLREIVSKKPLTYKELTREVF
ncbi:MAG: IS1595 family transposase [Nitrososphaerales archaeon]|jgi:transposase-like protein